MEKYNKFLTNITKLIEKGLFNSKDLKKDYGLIHTLMGNDVSLRKDFIVENAINVSNLDV